MTVAQAAVKLKAERGDAGLQAGMLPVHGSFDALQQQQNCFSQCIACTAEQQLWLECSHRGVCIANCQMTLASTSEPGVAGLIFGLIRGISHGCHVLLSLVDRFVQQGKGCQQHEPCHSRQDIALLYSEADCHAVLCLDFPKIKT